MPSALSEDGDASLLSLSQRSWRDVSGKRGRLRDDPMLSIVKGNRGACCMQGGWRMGEYWELGGRQEVRWLGYMYEAVAW